MFASIVSISAGGTYNAILNLAEVDYIDSSGLGALVMSFTTLRKAGGKLKLLNLTRRNVELLVLTKLETVFEVFDDEQNAVNSFFPDRKIKHFDILTFLREHNFDFNKFVYQGMSIPAPRAFFSLLLAESPLLGGDAQVFHIFPYSRWRNRVALEPTNPSP